MSETWTIGELAEHAARALRDGAAPLSGRVRDVPGERLIRWYTTIGLLDPPLTRRGRVARYGRRHLLQLVAVKRLQAAGRSIADIQAALAGATDHTLEETASLPAHPAPHPPAHPAPHPPAHPAPHPPAHPAIPSPAQPPVLPSASPPVAPSVPPPVASADGTPGGRGRFWAERPAAGSGSTPATAGDPMVVTGISLGGGVRLVWDGGRVPSEEDVQAVLAAAGPLLAVLTERKLT
ncbi:helix-turn-helix domain-containing protein [Nonomuraea bangladeshensis]|uniref:helix-turn-helix domain-containing protein n=1 Tax=Nonomuraea bangladeshensis TaxID=404385 RepID=UPI003C2E0F15